MSDKEGKLTGKKVMLTEAVGNPIKNLKRMFEVLIEKYDAGYVNCGPQALMTLFSEGRDTGLILDSGDGVTHTIPIADFMVLKSGIKRLDLAGSNVTA